MKKIICTLILLIVSPSMYGNNIEKEQEILQHFQEYQQALCADNPNIEAITNALKKARKYYASNASWLEKNLIFDAPINNLSDATLTQLTLAQWTKQFNTCDQNITVKLFEAVTKQLDITNNLENVLSSKLKLAKCPILITMLLNQEQRGHSINHTTKNLLLANLTISFENGIEKLEIYQQELNKLKKEAVQDNDIKGNIDYYEQKNTEREKLMEEQKKLIMDIVKNNKVLRERAYTNFSEIFQNECLLKKDKHERKYTVFDRKAHNKKVTSNSCVKAAEILFQINKLREKHP